jgi:hypothetical protein
MKPGDKFEIRYNSNLKRTFHFYTLEERQDSTED